MWALRRRLLYGLCLALLILVPFFLMSYHYFYKNPICTDGLSNGGEVGIDCGGPCSLICTQDVIPVETVWASTFLADDGTYDIGILFRNKNSGSAPKLLSSKVQVTSARGEILFRKNTTTYIPIAGEIPIVFQKVSLKDLPDKVILRNVESGSFAIENKVVNPLKIETSFDKETKKSVRVTVTNLTKKDLTRFPLKVVIFDENNKPLTVAESFVDSLNSGESKKVNVILGKRFEIDPPFVRAYAAINPYGL